MVAIPPPGSSGVPDDNWSPDPQGKPALAGTAVLQKAFDLLDHIGEAPGQLDSADLAYRTGMPRATLYRILAALQARGLVRTDPGRQTYSPGFHLIELAQNVWSSSDLVSVAASELRRLRDMTGETSYLAVMHEGTMRSLGRFDGAHSRRSAAALGVTKPVHCTSQGKAMLSHLSLAQVTALLTPPLQRFTDKTITDVPQLLAQLDIARARGFAIDDEEILEGTRCAGAAILNAMGQPIGAISVAGPTFRVTQRRAEQLGHELAAATQRISQELNRTGAVTTSVISSATTISTAQAFLGASALWHARTAAMVWIDQLGPAVHWHDATPTSITLDTLDRRIDGAFLTADGVVLLTRGVAILVNRDGTQRRLHLGAEFQASAVRTDPRGRVWVAEFNTERNVSVIGLLTPTGPSEPLWELSGEVTSLAISSDGAAFYAAVPGRNTIYVMNEADGRKRVFSRLPEATGAPMGLALDAEDRLWVGAYEGWSVVRLDADGEFERVVPLPVPTPTSLAFGGPDLSTLYITSARSGLSTETLHNAPQSGRLLALQSSVAGVAEPMAAFRFPA
ncbi:IclR family transcriptional regulator domain-containing protein [Kaistia terrae]|uniref:SMP-30/gluconolactonase/LRE family protein n=1 Tax=Kaistia terrae TaxID=537017 RepID=A0ABW0PRA5_9HYPH|nr:SMP-30/gluconolactonase/LRE family protein [Kaistia terrae]MCX5580056.1 SMP-30/gluconolactonase/LRE family protein [Kaistia terrae]